MPNIALAEAGEPAFIKPKFTDRAKSAPLADLTGKTVLLIHPAWTFCGSHRVFVSQAGAYKALGARVIALAFADSPGRTGGTARRDYSAATQDLKADIRYYTGSTGAGFFHTALQWLHGNYAAVLLESAQRIKLPEDLVRQASDIDLIHCNHFFCMPLARKLRVKTGCPVILDTHDLQARQYAARARSEWCLPPRATYKDMLSIELREMQSADALIHLNDEEALAFQALLPDRIHKLIYPAVSPVSQDGTGEAGDFVIIASANYPNYLSTEWFLKEILPLAGNVKVRIIGNVVQEFRKRNPRLLKKHVDLFEGVTGNLDQVYGNAAGILLPTVTGEGISIKTIEALSSGIPLIATRHAFRGMNIDLSALSNVTAVDAAAPFAKALSLAAARPRGVQAERRCSDTRRLYEQMFAMEVYRDRLASLIAALL